MKRRILLIRIDSICSLEFRRKFIPKTSGTQFEFYKFSQTLLGQLSAKQVFGVLIALANSPVFNQECISRNFVAGRFQSYWLYSEISRARNVYPQRPSPHFALIVIVERLF